MDNYTSLMKYNFGDSQNTKRELTTLEYKIIKVIVSHIFF